MEWHKWAALVFSSLFISMGTDAHAVTIDDVFVDGQAVPGTPVSGANCVEFSIGTTGGTDYGKMVIQGSNGTSAAKILAIEQGATCFGKPVHATRDRLFLVNTRITPKTTGVNVDLNIEYSADFGPTPNGAVVFGGFIKGTIFKNNTPQTCVGAPPNGPCQIVYKTLVFSQVDSLEHALPVVSKTNPLGGLFNLVIPANPAINVGTLNRTSHVVVTTKLPSTAHRTEIDSTSVMQGPPHEENKKGNNMTTKPPAKKES